MTSKVYTKKFKIKLIPISDEDDAELSWTICKDIITRLSPYPWPGNHVYTDIVTNIEYENCVDDYGEQMAPNDILLRMEQMAKLGRDMHHTHGNGYLQPNDMKRAFFNIFSDDMQEWLRMCKV